MLTGFTAPLTPTGRSSLIPAPPWHYAAWIFTIEYELDPAVAGRFLPPELGRATGLASMNFTEWQVTSDGSELQDPAYAQYKESFVLIETELADGSHANFTPLIYVDQDLSMMRGWLQGLPKKLGSVWMTRSFGLDHFAAAPLQAGTRLGATLALLCKSFAASELRTQTRLSFPRRRNGRASAGSPAAPSGTGTGRPIDAVIRAIRRANR